MCIHIYFNCFIWLWLIFFNACVLFDIFVCKLEFISWHVWNIEVQVWKVSNHLKEMKWKNMKSCRKSLQVMKWCCEKIQEKLQEKIRDVVWVSWGGQMPPPRKFLPPPRIPWGGQNKLSFGDIIYGKLNLFCPPKQFLAGAK